MATSTGPELQLLSSRHITNRAWMDGDSGVGGAYGYSLPIGLRNAGWVVISTGVGSSTMAEIRDRVIANAPLIRQCAALVIFDLSNNGLVTVDAYTDELETAVSAAGVRTIVVPAWVGFGNDGAKPTSEAIRDEFEARWPTNTCDWRDFVANTAGVVNEDRMAAPPGDLYHGNQTAYDELGVGIAAMLS
jgi:hypothetical protein